MPERAKVGSLEAIESFRSTLLVYIAQARSALEEVSSEVLRTRLWLENDQWMHWEREMRLRGRRLEEAHQALLSARLSKFSNAVALQQMEVHRARRAVDEGDLKLRKLKKWLRDFEGSVVPLLKQVEQFHNILTNDLAKGAADLARTIAIIAAYAEAKPPAGPSVSPKAAAGASAEEEKSPPK